MGTRIHPEPGEPFCDACHLGEDVECTQGHEDWVDTRIAENKKKMYPMEFMLKRELKHLSECVHNRDEQIKILREAIKAARDGFSVHSADCKTLHYIIEKVRCCANARHLARINKILGQYNGSDL